MAGICLALLCSLLVPATARAQNGDSYELSIVTYGLGRVTGDAIDCGAGQTACVATYDEPRTVALTANPASGHVFLGWIGSCSGIETTTVHVDSPKHCEAFFDPAEPTSPRTLLALDSGPGDYVGRGARYLYSSIDTAWQVSADGNRLLFALESVDGSWWYARFSAPRGASLEPGVYPNAKRWQFNSVSPGLEVYGNGRGCEELTGRFVVHEIVMDDFTGALLSFAADFEQHCEHADAALFGAVRYNSLVPGVSAFGGA
ncbi:MAG: InlB B-repeat-containing protein, partial [Vicinamibacterales bacterium]